jgi:hypothetical protein
MLEVEESPVPETVTVTGAPPAGLALTDDGVSELIMAARVCDCAMLRAMAIAAMAPSAIFAKVRMLLPVWFNFVPPR